MGKTPDTAALDEYWDSNKLDDDHRSGSAHDSHSDGDASHSNGQLDGYQKSLAMSASTLFTRHTILLLLCWNSCISLDHLCFRSIEQHYYENEYY